MTHARLKGVFAPIDIDREGTLRSIERLTAATTAVSSAEYLARPREFGRGSLGDWTIIGQRFSHLPKWQQRILEAASRPGVSRALHAGRLLAAAVLLAPTPSKLRAFADGYLALSAAALYPRSTYGSDGSDQVGFQTSSATFVARVIPTQQVQDGAIWYVALQSALAYAVSGWVKVFGRSWRTGTAVPGVMRTHAYGNKRLWEFFKDRPRVALMSAHAMLAFEGLFPLVFLAKGRLTKPFLLAAAGFHTAIAGSMGLGRFLTAFGSMLPAIAYATNDRPKSKLVPAMALTTIAAALVGGAAGGLMRSSRVRRGHHGDHRITCSSGNSLRYQRRRSSRRGAPVLVLEHGMASTPEHFAWIIEHLPADTEVITYWRAGYGPSENISGGYGIDDSGEDLADLVESLPADVGPIFLGGHSLGGLVARHAAQVTDRPIAGVIYLDSSHPGQLSLSDGQRRGADGLSTAFTAVPSSLRVGLGWLLPRPAWVRSLPEHAQGRALDQYRDFRLWLAGSREWATARRRFSRKRGSALAAMTVPALVVTAELTLRGDPAQDRLHADLAGSHRDQATRVVIRGADHDSILTRREHAEAASEAIVTFMSEAAA
ncbi:alpha/beta fold hydrolase [Leifsonia virtsii]|uniref:Alpha/beta fold hydrolase n=1 Tax=Leifsonia virtsii TaxID=3035915 RepID=A0ABT8J0R2_9MICO|nr:alpha/beta fold hydrolase [Leifsonia virtsii]MDN4597854.1 alpha/beta fold hydrolase [Leifsonia virtsii]